jgi:hypothetical protein
MSLKLIAAHEYSSTYRSSVSINDLLQREGIRENFVSSNNITVNNHFLFLFWERSKSNVFGGEEKEKL